MERNRNFHSVAFIKTNERPLVVSSAPRVASPDHNFPFSHHFLHPSIIPIISSPARFAAAFSDFSGKNGTRSTAKDSAADDSVDRDEDHVFLSIIALRLFSQPVFPRYQRSRQFPTILFPPLFSSNTPFSGRMTNKRFVLVDSKLQLLAIFVFPIVL